MSDSFTSSVSSISAGGVRPSSLNHLLTIVSVNAGGHLNVSTSLWSTTSSAFGATINSITSESFSIYLISVFRYPVIIPPDMLSTMRNSLPLPSHIPSCLSLVYIASVRILNSSSRFILCVNLSISLLENSLLILSSSSLRLVSSVIAFATSVCGRSSSDILFIISPMMS